MGTELTEVTDLTELCFHNFFGATMFSTIGSAMLTISLKRLLRRPAVGGTPPPSAGFSTRNDSSFHYNVRTGF